MPQLAAISLLLPAMLGGLALLSLPILAHLLNRKAKRTVVFPSIELLAASAASHTSLFKLRRWLLLLLRCLAVALLVLGFAQPLWVDTPAKAANPSRGAGVVLLVDLSASAGQRSGGVTALQSLRSAASRTLDSLVAGDDTANLVYATAHPRAAFPRMTANLDAIRQELQSLEPTEERANLPGAVALAGQMLARQAGDRQLVVLTDLQATNWHDVIESMNSAEGEGWSSILPPDTRVTIVPLDAPPPGNIGLSDATLRPAVPIVNRPAAVTVRVTNYAGEPGSARVRLRVNDRTVGRADVLLGPNESREVPFTVKLEHVGDHRIVFESEPDGLDADNRWHVVAHAAQRIPVAVIGDDAADEPGTSTYFLTRALAPRDGLDDPYQVHHLRSDRVTAQALRGITVVLVSDVNRLHDAAARSLYEYMEAGGSVIFFAGDSPVAGNLASLDRLDPPGVSPWTPGPRQDLAAHGESLRITGGQWRSPLLDVFDLHAQESIGGIGFTRVWPAAELRDDARVLLRFSDGSPALADRPVGAGRLVLAAFGPALADSDLGKHGAFVALVQNLTQALQPTEQTTRKRHAGQSLTFEPDLPIAPDDGLVMVIGPDEQPVTDAQVIQGDGHPVVAVARATQPGFYAAVQGDRVIGQAAVNLDPRESDLHRLPAKELAAALETTGLQTQIHSSSSGNAVLRLRGVPLWGWMLLAAMLAFGIEMLLLGVWRR